MWNRIVFVDQSGIDNSGSHRRRVRRPPNTRSQNDSIEPHKNRTMRKNFHSYITCYGTGRLDFHKTMNGILWCRRIDSMVYEVRILFRGDNFFIIHDNAKFSNSEGTIEYLEHHNLTRFFIRHPVYSPDMNPIENGWSYLKMLLKKEIDEKGQPRGGGARKKFEKLIETIWNNIPVDFIKRLYQLLPNRMREVANQESNLSRY